MRQRSERSSGHVHKDLTEQLTSLIRNLESSKTPCTRSTLIKELSTLCSIKSEQAENAIEGAIRQCRIIELYSTTQLSEPVCHDVLRLRIRRTLRLNSNYDLSYIVRTALMERGARSSQDARSMDEIHDHIMTTYTLQENSVEYLSNCLDKAIKLLSKKNQIEAKVPLNDNDTRYFLTSTTTAGTSILPSAVNTRPSTSTIKDENVSSISPTISSPSPNHKSSKRREKRLSEASSYQTTDSSSKSELKSLQDSLSAFFTPSNVRRSRVAQSSFSLEHLNDHKVRSPLEVVINNGEEKKLNRRHSNEIHSVSSSKYSSPSPNNKHTDKLFDSLSPYFSANNERRRKHEKGEYLQLSNGGAIPPNKKVRSSMQSSVDTNSLLASIERPNRHSDFFDDELSESDEDETLNTLSNQNHLLTVHRKAALDSVPNDPLIENESVAELEIARASSPSTSHKKSRASTRNTESAKKATRSSQIKTSNNLKSFKSRKLREKSAISRVSNNLLKRARQQCHARLVSVNNRNRRASSVLPMTPKKSRTEVPASSTIINSSTKNNPLILASPIRRTSFSPVKSFNMSLTSKAGDETPVKIGKADEALYLKTRMVVQKRMDDNSKLMYEKSEEGIFPSKIRIGHFEINTWYSSPFPHEFVCLPMLYICERCLVYTCNDHHEKDKCKLSYPPGNEIYRSNNLSVFEVDGNLARVYCRNLCLLAKLFMDHKTLYFDVEPFLFYVLTVTDEHGCHFVGYFSKEKYSHQQFNLACIVTLPCYQKKGYGRFLIDFSYLLSRREKMLGTPERPLSEMGKVAYNSYWRTAIFEYLHQRRENGELQTLSAMEIARETGIVVHDVVDALKNTNFLQPSNGEVIAKNQNLIWTIDWDMVNKHWTAAKKSDRRIWLDELKLHWTPKVYTPNTDFLLRSPLRSPVFSPNNSPRKMLNFSSTIQPVKRPNHTPQKASTSRIPIVQKSPKKKKQQNNRLQGNGKAAVFPKDVKGSGSQSDDDDQESSGNRQQSSRLNKWQSPVANSTSKKETPFEDRSDSDTNSRQPRSALSTVALKSNPRNTNRSYLSCASNSSSEDEDTIIERTNSFCNSNQNSPPINHRLFNGVARKKLPAEVERAQQRSQQQQTSNHTLTRRQLEKTPSLSTEESSDDDYSNFVKSAPTRRSSGGKKRMPIRKPSTKSIKSTNEENNVSKRNSRSRANSRKSGTSRRATSKSKKKSPSKQQKSRKSLSKSPPPTITKVENNERALNQDENTDEDDEPYRSCRSSASPPPIGKRPTRYSILHRTSLNQPTETVNMGGDSDLVNIGWNPEDESQPSYTHSQTPKAPKPHATVEEDEENELTSRHNHSNSQLPVQNFAASSTNPMSFVPPQIEQQTWSAHKQSIDSVPNNYVPVNYVNTASFNNIAPSSFQQPTVGFPSSLPVNNIEMPVPQNSSHVKFMIDPASPDQTNEMPVLKPGLDEVDDEMPTLTEDDAGDDAPPELSPMPNLSENNNLENDEPDSIEPPKLEDSTIPVTASQPSTQASTHQVVNSAQQQQILKATSFDSFVDQKTAMLRKKSMPATISTAMLCASASTDERFENDTFGSATPLAIPQIQQQHQSPAPPPTIHHNNYNNVNSHSNQMFSPQQIAVHTPNSHQPQSHASNSTASESGINVSIMSPPTLQKPVEHLPPPPYTNIPASQQTYSPPKPLINTKSSGSRKESKSRHTNATSRRRNTTDGTTLKSMTPSEQQPMDPKFAQQPAMANNAALNGMFFSPSHLMNPYLMPTPLATPANTQFNAIAHQSAYNNYDYTATPAQGGYPALYNGNFYPPYQATGDMMLNPGVPSMANQLAFYHQIQQSQQQQLPQMLQTPQLPNFGPITNAAIANNPAAAASLMNNGSAGSLFYNGFS